MSILTATFLLLAGLPESPQDDRCGTCKGSGTVEVVCARCDGKGYNGWTTFGGQKKALGCEPCGGSVGNEYSGRQGRGRVSRECGSCDGSGAGPARVAEIRRQKADAARKAKEEADRKAKEEEDRPIKTAREKALEEQKRLAEKQANDSRIQAGLTNAQQVLGSLRQRLRTLDLGGLADGQVVSELPSFGGPLTKTLFDKGSTNSAPVDSRPGAADKLDADLTLEFAEIQDPPAQLPKPRHEAPDPRDLQFLFPGDLFRSPEAPLGLVPSPNEPRHHHWHGPPNPGPKLKNPLIEQEKARKAISEVVWALLHAKNAEELMKDHLTVDHCPTANGVPLREELSAAQNKALDQSVGELIRGFRDSLDVLRKTSAREIFLELDKMRDAGLWKTREEFVLKQTFDLPFRISVNESRERILLRFGENVEKLHEKLDRDIRDRATKILKDK